MKPRLGALLAASALAIGSLALTGPAASAAPGVTATFAKPQDWGSGFEGKYTITNGGPGALTSWKVEFDLPEGTSLGSYWDALITRTGNHYVATNREYNGSLSAGATRTFGFVGTGTGVPANCKVNGASCEGGGGDDTTAPTAPANLRATDVTANAVALAWDAATDNVAVTGYDVYRGDTVATSVTGTTATVSGLTPATAYQFTVRAKDAAGNTSDASNQVTATTKDGPDPIAGRGAPYLFLGWGNPPAPQTVMKATGIKWFTMAFVLAQGGCNPAWDGNRPLTGGIDATAINQIRAAGGDVVPSFGGWSGNKLGPNCSTPQALAGAYQKVIDAYRLKAIDIDIENTDEFENAAVQDRILEALKIVKQANPGIQTIVTIPTTRTGPNSWGNRLIERSQALGANIDVYTLMPFDFGSSNVRADTIAATTALKNKLKSVFGWSDAVAFNHSGISGMNGLSDQKEVTTTADWTALRDWAKSNGLGRFAFWAVNRDRGGCDGQVSSNCSGIPQADWEFTRITAGF
ncbi:cellulose binding domain-containing protein [Saccharothrix australiensis]|uniref:Fibronectin type III domain protein n=1 Tax=Saccharothrix australiensis TaxID=2072 RepID=A0A495W8D1_9PSEU|nr:cellulose binding domain-containing protein [Saccharothrix australiensis]RKT57397.1 fibronectin type III domain protein [Saccharothrix australiensis]